MNADNVQQMKSSMGKLQLIQAAFVVAMPLFVWITQSVCGQGRSDWTLWHWVMTGLALYAAWGGFFSRHRMMRRSEESLRKDSANPKSLKQWQAAQIIGMPFAEAIVLYGVVVRMVLRGTVWQAAPFYAAGLFLLLLWTPRMPTTPA
jgi:F0F1-type ATP synthase membrane subunit c/vacuolar-type H+-ATPase subunit K